MNFLRLLGLGELSRRQRPLALQQQRSPRAAEEADRHLSVRASAAMVEETTEDAMGREDERRHRRGLIQMLRWLLYSAPRQ